MSAPISRFGPSSLSILQEKILQIVCTQENVTYKTLIEQTARDRITVLQSVNSLIKHSYIVKEKEQPANEKSKLSFKPTISGKQFAAFKMKVDLEEILKAEKDEKINNYFNVIEGITDISQRQLFVRPLERLLELPVSFDNEVRLQQIKKNILLQALKKGIIEFAQINKFDSNDLINEKSVQFLEKLLSPAEIRELRHLLITMRNRLTRTIERLPT